MIFLVLLRKSYGVGPIDFTGLGIGMALPFFLIMCLMPKDSPFFSFYGFIILACLAASFYWIFSPGFSLTAAVGLIWGLIGYLVRCSMNERPPSPP